MRIVNAFIRQRTVIPQNIYSSAIGYLGQKGLIDDIVIFRMFDV